MVPLCTTLLHDYMYIPVIIIPTNNRLHIYRQSVPVSLQVKTHVLGAGIAIKTETPELKLSDMHR